MSAPSVHHLTGAILAAVDGEATYLAGRGEGVVLAFEIDGAAFRLQLEPLKCRHTDDDQEGEVQS